ncbi:MAG: CDP-alcohol phosphatidyltransferase family protein [Thermodesulfovibrionia bacterium]|nr:CDP-alcohol phosphatidyltransferase family protein [Thermodesulfovibrionia bacterium]
MVGNLPNILTIARILLLPFFAASLIYGNYQYALILFLAAAITDILDGLIARIKKQTTDLGSILDPVADKFLMITSFIVMSVYGWIPKWLTITVISRDLIVVTGWLILYFVTHNKKVEPSILGKAANFFQFCLIGLILISINTKNASFVPRSYLIAVAALTAASGVLYIYKGLKIANVSV